MFEFNQFQNVLAARHMDNQNLNHDIYIIHTVYLLICLHTLACEKQTVA